MPPIAIIVSFSLLFFLNACAIIAPEINHNTEVDQLISVKDLPPKVLMVLPKEYGKNEFTYMRKLKNGIISYSVDYEKDRKIFSIDYDEQGKVLREEKKVEFSDIPYDLRIKVEKVLSEHYPNYTILLVEEVYTDNEMLLEVSFSHHKAKTGLVEAFFEYQSGTLREFVNIKMKSIETLN